MLTIIIKQGKPTLRYHNSNNNNDVTLCIRKYKKPHILFGAAMTMQ